MSSPASIQSPVALANCQLFLPAQLLTAAAGLAGHEDPAEELWIKAEVEFSEARIPQEVWPVVTVR